jgi:hypothetical protein
MGNSNSASGFTPGEDITKFFFQSSLQPWSLLRGVSKKDAAAVTIFACARKKDAPSQTALAQHSVKKIKTLKHPFILQVLVSTPFG